MPKLSAEQIAQVPNLVADYIATQRERFFPQGAPLDATQKAAMDGFFLPVSLACGVGASALHYLLNLSSSIPCVGASGAISGIVGIYFVLFPKSRFDLCIYLGWWHIKTIPARTHAAVGAWIGEQTLLGLRTEAVPVSSVAFWAHVGGFLTGVAAALLFMRAVPAEQRRMAERAKPWYMQDSVNRDEEHITRLKL